MNDLDEIMEDHMEADVVMGRGVNSQVADLGQSVVEGGMNLHVGMNFQGRPSHVPVPDLNEVALLEVAMNAHTEGESRAILPFVRLFTYGFPRGIEFESNQERNKQIAVVGHGDSSHNQGDFISRGGTRCAIG